MLCPMTHSPKKKAVITENLMRTVGQRITSELRKIYKAKRRAAMNERKPPREDGGR
jgi:hypothetical protein